MAARFENMSIEDLLTPRKRIVWTEYTIKKILAFCAKYQVSDRNRPSPGQLITLMDMINAPAEPDAWLAAVSKTLSFIDRHTSKNKFMTALVEEEVEGEWVCKWFVWSELWTLPGWNGDIKKPAGLTTAQQQFRGIVPRRHSLGHKRLADTAAAMLADMVTKKALASTIEPLIETPPRVRREPCLD